MFGYIVFNQDELKFREFKLYRSYYCGLCSVLHKNYGRAGQLTLSYDTTFLALLLSSLYEPEDAQQLVRCIVHPLSKHPTRVNPCVEYAADINVLLSYYSCRDDWSDEHSALKLALASLLSGGRKKICASYPEKAEVIRTQLSLLSDAEKENSADIDRVSGYFGTLMSEVFAMRQDEWENTLRRMGFYLGKFIYILDAYDDLEKDRKKNVYNPFLAGSALRKKAAQAGESDPGAGQAAALPPDPSSETFEEEVRMILTMMMAECAKCFETLPVLNNVEILRNILYSGVWSKFEDIGARRRGEERKQTKAAEEVKIFY